MIQIVKKILTLAQVKRWVKLVTHQKPMYVHFARRRMRSRNTRDYMRLYATIRDYTLTHGNSAEPSPVEGFPMRSWSIEIWLLDDAGNEVMPNVFEKAVYNLHPSFEKNKHGECARQQCAG
jgi:hypothetical protein